ncbi:MAG: permease [Deltaproteobacteria bacterium]|nr:permease [Deltaproteobacteria bacterium]
MDASDAMLGIAKAAWVMLTMASPYILLGLAIAGLMRAVVKPEQIARHLGGNTLRSLGLGALAGVPLPLCSCGVVPTAMALRQQGASKPATVAFLISTPESGVDSIAVTYALLGPAMAIIRPIAAFLTAFVAGVAEMLFEARGAKGEVLHAPRTPNGEQQSIWFKLRSGFHFAFIVLLKDISGWFLLGILIGGVISYAIPESFIRAYMGGGWQAMLVMLAIGIPLYICASASTPIAAALMLKGMSPGAALVFLLAGPATNAASLPVLLRFLGKRAVAIYLAAIAVCSVGIGILVDYFAAALHISVGPMHTHAHHSQAASLGTACAAILLLLIAMAHGRRFLGHRQTA